MKTKIITLLILLFSLPVFSQEILSNGCDSLGIHSSSDYWHQLNILKNRRHNPLAVDYNSTITLTELIRKHKDQFSYSNYEAAAVTGYVKLVKRGADELCNCNATDTNLWDYHIEVVPTANTTSARKTFVVEVTPRSITLMTANGTAWTNNALYNLQGHFVTFKGWMFWDNQHKGNANNTAKAGTTNVWRSTAWELHPVTEITVQ